MRSEGLRLGPISGNPALLAEHLKERPKENRVRTLEKVPALFNDAEIGFIWHDDLRAYSLGLPAASRGMRMEEVQGLQLQHVDWQVVDVESAIVQCSSGKPVLVAAEQGKREALHGGSVALAELPLRDLDIARMRMRPKAARHRTKVERRALKRLLRPERSPAPEAEARTVLPLPERGGGSAGLVTRSLLRRLSS